MPTPLIDRRTFRVRYGWGWARVNGAVSPAVTIGR